MNKQTTIKLSLTITEKNNYKRNLSNREFKALLWEDLLEVVRERGKMCTYSPLTHQCTKNVQAPAKNVHSLLIKAFKHTQNVHGYLRAIKKRHSSVSRKVKTALNQLFWWLNMGSIRQIKTLYIKTSRLIIDIAHITALKALLFHGGGRGVVLINTSSYDFGLKQKSQISIGGRLK